MYITFFLYLKKVRPIFFLTHLESRFVFRPCSVILYIGQRENGFTGSCFCGFAVTQCPYQRKLSQTLTSNYNIDYPWTVYIRTCIFLFYSNLLYIQFFINGHLTRNLEINSNFSWMTLNQREQPYNWKPRITPTNYIRFLTVNVTLLLSTIRSISQLIELQKLKTYKYLLHNISSPGPCLTRFTNWNLPKMIAQTQRWKARLGCSDITNLT